MSRKRTGCIYKEPHNHGKSNNGGQRNSVRFIKGVGMQRIYGYRWVAEIKVDGVRYRKRSADLRVVQDWLSKMVDLYGEY